jgi:hypothetical protein
MGMDGAHLIMEIERHFGLSLRPSECHEVVYVSDLVTIIQNRLIALRNLTKLTEDAFQLLQSLVREVVGDATMRILPQEHVQDHLTPRQRRTLWKHLREKLELRIDDLQLPWWLGRIVQGVYLRLVILTLWLSFTVTGHYFIIGLVGIPIIALATNPIIDLWRHDPPPGWRTFGEITSQLVGLVAATKQTHLQTRDEILAELRPLLVDVIGCKPELVTMHAHLVQDLGLN